MIAFKQKSNSLGKANIRVVHGSLRVGFLPNLKLTRPCRVSNIQTCHRPVRWVGSSDSDIDWWWSVVGRTWRRQKMSKCARNGRNQTGQYLLDLANTWLDLVRFLKELTRSQRDLSGSQWICQDLNEISLDLNVFVEKLLEIPHTCENWWVFPI